jgi:(p)ppGpp synthase/HD superfamily hydrolase
VSGILHDVVEDTPRTLVEIAYEFGKSVATIVDYVSEVKTDPAEKKLPWKARKVDYISRLADAPYEAVLVASADKLHNLRDTLADYEKHGDDVWSMFNSQKDSQFWYYNELITIFDARGIPKTITDELKRMLTDIHYRLHPLWTNF